MLLTVAMPCGFFLCYDSCMRMLRLFPSIATSSSSKASDVPVAQFFDPEFELSWQARGWANSSYSVEFTLLALRSFLSSSLGYFYSTFC